MPRVSASEVDSESARLAVLYSYDIVDTPPEADFDEMVRQAAQEFNTPVAALSLIDATRVWFKAQTGFPPANPVTELARNVTFCDFAMRTSGTFVVPDAVADGRFANLPLVAQENGFRFYAGAPLQTNGGHTIGTLCVLDTQPRQPTAGELEKLRQTADRVMQLLDLRRSRRILAASFPPFTGKTETPGTAPRVLVVDDDAAVREFVCLATRQLGYEVAEASNGAEALRLLQREPRTIELVLTDVNMPVMDGLELARTLKTLPAMPRIAAMSGHFDSQIRAALRATGVEALLSKPFSMDELEVALRQLRANAG